MPLPRPLATSVLFSVSVNWPELVTFSKETCTEVSFCVWLISLSVTFPRPTHSEPCVSSSLLSTPDHLISPSHRQTTLVYPSLADGHLGCLRLLAIVSDGYEHLCSGICIAVFSAFGCKPGVKSRDLW